VSAEDSDAYFATRPRDSQLGAWASPQSQPLRDRTALDTRLAEVVDRFEAGEVPRPPHWGGYLLRHERVEFWQGRERRMHDRLAYRRDDTAPSGWRIERLAP
jgi:pyridoxamine 5'-phosphate oxidase